jgi:hypothetical protein
MHEALSLIPNTTKKKKKEKEKKKVLLCSPGWPQTQDSPASASQVLEFGGTHNRLVSICKPTG